jgi:hypothetical protein
MNPTNPTNKTAKFDAEDLIPVSSKDIARNASRK